MSTSRMQKNLTVMFTDISGFTKHTETISRQDLMSRLDTHNELLMPIVAHFDGKIVKTIGDAFLITFESPTNAVQCGLFMQHTLRKFNVGKDESHAIHIKVSINSGEVTVTENDVFGDPVNVAAKIEKATNPDEIYFTEAVFLAMNKSEVPTSFVKTFRPKGAESNEIKLYKVAMDEADERYQKVIKGTNIDKEKNKTRVLELTTLAEKEFTRYQDTLEALVESQGKSSRGMVIAVIAAALILATAIIVGLAVFSGPAENPEGKVIESARAYLSSGKPEDARTLLLKHIEAHGGSDALKDALAEVDTYELNAATRTTEELLAGDRPDQALSAIKAALRDRAPSDVHKALIQRAQAYVDARSALAEGDSAKCLALTEIAAGEKGFTDGLKRLREQAQAIDSARKTIQDEKLLKEQSNAALEKLAMAFGDQPSIPLVIDLMKQALSSKQYWDARNKSYAEAKTQLERYRQRFLTIGDWSIIERDMHLGGFWNYATDTGMRRNWWSWYDTNWQNHYKLLCDAAANDPDFEYTLGVNIYGINRRLSLVRTNEQNHVGNAIRKKPELFEANRAAIKDMVMNWLAYGMQDDDLARELVRKHFYEEIRDWLVEGLTASSKYMGEVRPEFSKRQNCFALLADRAELGSITDPFGYFRDNFEIFMENNWPGVDEAGNPVATALTREQVRRLFEMKMSLDDYKEFRRLIGQTMDDIGAKTGRWSIYTYARETIRMMLEDLKAAQPAHEAAISE
ncbi:MAG: adenylate/guanylate cyclase domain-containing protein [Planctomycetes bacterium]|nr:adenylate/guanylate cyclase domain-containing protein [Planctomycetota bacterium]